MKLKALTDIIPLMEQGYKLTEIGRMLKPRRSKATMYVYARRLREAGHVLPPRKAGRPKIPVSVPEAE